MAFFIFTSGVKRTLPITLGLIFLVVIWRGVAISLHLWDYETGVFYVRPCFRFDPIAVGCWLALVPLRPSPRWVLFFRPPL
jgi:hypothetical protein